MPRMRARATTVHGDSTWIRCLAEPAAWFGAAAGRSPSSRLRDDTPRSGDSTTLSEGIEDVGGAEPAEELESMEPLPHAQHRTRRSVQATGPSERVGKHAVRRNCNEGRTIIQRTTGARYRALTCAASAAAIAISVSGVKTEIARTSSDCSAKGSAMPVDRPKAPSNAPRVLNGV